MINKILNKNLGSHSSGYSLAFLANNQNQIHNTGNLSYNYPGLVNDETLYDIASLSKTFTAILTFIAVQDGIFDLDTEICDIDPAYKNLGHIKISDLLAHRQEIWTPRHLKEAKSKEQMIDLLNESYVYSQIPQYSDVHYMLLGRLLEESYKKDYQDLVYEKMKTPYNLSSLTYSPSKENLADTRFEVFPDKSINQDERIGLPHDPKSRLAIDYGLILGHAGIFINSKDLLKFLQAIMEENIIKGDFFKSLLDHDDINGLNKEKLKESKDIKIQSLSKPYCLMGARLRNEIEEENEIPDKSSDKTVYFSGYTGPAYLLDFKNKIIIVLMSNLTHHNTYMRLERKKIANDMIKEVYGCLIEE
ncbi:serine hydrolase [uncultured Helcococcus sp.]|uniref:serine hydrolase domain-containing protein n=1 Tax=uncultured Helcococcus sp. TaxID=1072508 RepID=UPI00261640A8|nr:serine hydrolase domain-containing protein [uncultured Helcococcus sp.]